VAEKRNQFRRAKHKIVPDRHCLSDVLSRQWNWFFSAAMQFPFFSGPIFTRKHCQQTLWDPVFLFNYYQLAIVFTDLP